MEFYDRWKNFKTMTLSGHTDIVEKCFFDENSLDVLTISRNGQVFFWECNFGISDLIPDNGKSETTVKKQVIYNTFCLPFQFK